MSTDYIEDREIRRQEACKAFKADLLNDPEFIREAVIEAVAESDAVVSDIVRAYDQYDNLSISMLTNTNKWRTGKKEYVEEMLQANGFVGDTKLYSRLIVLGALMYNEINEYADYVANEQID